MAPLIISLHPQMTFIVKIGHFCYWTPRLMSDCVNIFYLTTYNILDKYNNKDKHIGQYENFETVYKYSNLWYRYRALD